MTLVILVFACVFTGPYAQAALSCQEIFLNFEAENLVAWRNNPDWSGETKIPTPLEIQVSITDDNNPNPTATFFSTNQTINLPHDLKSLVKAMKRQTRPLSDDEAEVGAIVARYGDNSSKGIRFTSRRRESGLYAIDGQDMGAAINQSAIFPNKKFNSVELVVHLHTHPNLRNPRFNGNRTLIVPSVDDFEFWVGLRAQLRQYHTNPSFQAIVVPSGSAVEDIVFIIEDRHLDAYIREKERQATRK